MTNKLILFGNGSTANHGCEAIYLGTQQLLKNYNIRVLTDNFEEDSKSLAGKIEVENAVKPYTKRDWLFITRYLSLKFKNDYLSLDMLNYIEPIKEAKMNGYRIALSVGGDNYCYETGKKIARIHQEYIKEGFKTVLWECSVDPSVLEDKALVKDLESYDLIVAREMKSFGIIRQINLNTVYHPDPAFYMEPVEIREYQNFFFGQKVIGINLSPLISNYEKTDGVTMANYEYLIREILQKTDYSVALIPHVTTNGSNDFDVLNPLYDRFSKSGRIILVQEHSAPELKYIISCCHIFIGARTHSTIAAYSSGIPTIAVGYSTKAEGIAQDLLGDKDNYALQVQNLDSHEQLFEMFSHLDKNYEKVRSRLKRIVPEYLSAPVLADKLLSMVRSHEE